MYLLMINLVCSFYLLEIAKPTTRNKVVGYLATLVGVIYFGITSF